MESTTGRCPFAAQRDARGGAHPLHLRRSILNREILRPVLKQLGLDTMPDDPHVVLAHSHTPVDWDAAVFTPNPNRLAVSPIKPRFVRDASGDGDRVILAFDSPDLTARWRDLVEAGAAWDGPAFTPGIVIGQVSGPLPSICFFAGPILFGPEWRATTECV